MNEANHYFDRLETLVKNAIRSATTAERPFVQELLPFLASIRESLTLLPALQAKLIELQEQVSQLGEPPLQYGIFLGACPECAESMTSQTAQGRQVLWTRLERILDEAIERATVERERKGLEATREALRELRSQVETKRDLIVGLGGQRYEVNLAIKDATASQLREGQEVVLNKMMNVVGVRNHHVRGDTAEVANIISPSGTAKVMAVPDQSDKLQVRWAGGEKSDKFEVVCEPDLRRTLQRGDIVRLDESGQRAIGKVKPRLHVRSGGSEGIVVEISDKLFAEGVDIGDIVRVDTHLQFAFEKLPSYETGGLALEEVPDVTFEDIGGLDDQIEEIRDAIELPYLHRRLFDEYQLSRTKGIMLYGPPGCGKTMIAKAIANSLTQSIREHLQRLERRIDLYLRLRQDRNDDKALHQYRLLTQAPQQPGTGVAALPDNASADEALSRLADDLRANDVDPDAAEEALRRIQDVLRREEGIRSFFLNIKGPELLSKWVGESEHRIRKIFEEAKRSATFYTPVVIFFDEMEAMFRARGSGRSSDVETTIVPQFLSEMDGVESSENVIIIGASNRHDMIDPAIMRPGRLDVKIKVERPDYEAALKILALNLTPDLPLRGNGLKRPPEAFPRSVTFKPHIVRRTLQACKLPLTSDVLEAVLSAIPERCDVRRAVEKAPGLVSLCKDKKAMAAIEEAVQREQTAEALIAALADLIFSPASQLEATTSAGKRYTLPLREFVSGALLAGVISRAKKRAVKRRATQEGAEGGIAFHDLREALQEEFDESVDQLAANALERELAPRIPGQPGDTVQFVEVHLGEAEDDPWGVEKTRPYRP